MQPDESSSLTQLIQSPALPAQTRRVLGIDPGSCMTGFGVIDIIGHRHWYVASGTIATASHAVLAERLLTILSHLFEIIDTYQPTEAAIEKVFVNVNPTATLMLGQARGACISALVLRKLPVTEYTALQVKQAVVGHGKAAKEQVQHMVKQLLKLDGMPQPDAADAIAVALTHAHHSFAKQNPLLKDKQIKHGRFV